MNSREIRKYAKYCVISETDKVDYFTQKGKIRKSLKPNGENIYVNDEGNLTASFYLGSLISPSGKYYLPWACDNVLACPRCAGKGCAFCGELGSREAYEDELFWGYLDEYASKHNGWIESGEGDPTDTFLCFLIKENYEEDILRDSNRIIK